MQMPPFLFSSKVFRKPGARRGDGVGDLLRTRLVQILFIGEKDFEKDLCPVDRRFHDGLSFFLRRKEGGESKNG